MKNTQGEVWVFAEQEEGKLSDVPFELLGKARELASKLGVKVGAVLMGSGVESLAKPLFEAGADIVHIVDDPALKVYRNKAYRHAMVELVKEVNPQIAIFGATHMGRDLAPSVASALRCGLTADCTDLQIGDYEDKKTKEVFTNVLHQIRPATRTRRRRRRLQTSSTRYARLSAATSSRRSSMPATGRRWRPFARA